ncbi:MAG: hypothetical protein NVSMB56_04020 [Pyrinomonadaceae bacterium]
MNTFSNGPLISGHTPKKNRWVLPLAAIFVSLAGMVVGAAWALYKDDNSSNNQTSTQVSADKTVDIDSSLRPGSVTSSNAVSNADSIKTDERAAFSAVPNAADGHTMPTRLRDRRHQRSREEPPDLQSIPRFILERIPSERSHHDGGKGHHKNHKHGDDEGDDH